MIAEINKVFSVSFLVTDSAGQSVTNDCPVLTIRNAQTNKYFNGVSWSDSPSELSMNRLSVSGGVYTCSFTPNISGEYDIKCTSKDYGVESFCSINVGLSDSEPYTQSLNLSEVSIGSFNFDNGKDTNSVIKTLGNNPLGGVKISCINANGGITASSLSTSGGEWAMSIPHGTYTFIFEKDGFISKSYVRTV